MSTRLSRRPASRPAVRLATISVGIALTGIMGTACTGQAPTCGPCCHEDPPPEDCFDDEGNLTDAGMNMADDAGLMDDDAGIDPEPDQVAPTCGPCCHDPDGQECQDMGGP
jgi:hypothetical protein